MTRLCSCFMKIWKLKTYLDCCHCHSPESPWRHKSLPVQRTQTGWSRRWDYSLENWWCCNSWLRRGMRSYLCWSRCIHPLPNHYHPYTNHLSFRMRNNWWHRLQCLKKMKRNTKQGSRWKRTFSWSLFGGKNATLIVRLVLAGVAMIGKSGVTH